jgi:hypothetical protein
MCFISRKPKVNTRFDISVRYGGRVDRPFERTKASGGSFSNNPAAHFAAFALPNFVIQHFVAAVPLASAAEPRVNEDPQFEQTSGGHGPTRLPVGEPNPCTNGAYVRGYRGAVSSAARL